MEILTPEQLLDILLHDEHYASFKKAYEEILRRLHDYNKLKE